MPYEPLFEDKEQSAFYQRLINSVPPKSEIFLDLDGCIIDNRSRQIHLIREFASQHHLKELYSITHEHIWDWSLENTLARAGIKNTEYIIPLKQWFEKRFYDIELLFMDQVMPNALNFVEQLQNRDAKIIFLTGRLLITQKETKKTLSTFGFNDYMLVSRQSTQDEHAFKVSVLQNENPWLMMDNIPQNVNSAFGIAQNVIWISTDHSHLKGEITKGIFHVRSFIF